MSAIRRDTNIMLVDADHFFVACERLFNPKLRKRPVIILSSNDGVVVARSPEVYWFSVNRTFGSQIIVHKKFKFKVVETNWRPNNWQADNIKIQVG